ncbi:MAG: sigma-54 dependent transcriptional regulator [Deltaproteobacteria bacterium]|jgi:DNA-binding NtrC family response regulator
MHAPEHRPIAASGAMKEVFATVDKVAQAVVPVMVFGETGTGKEVIARQIHERGPRASQPIVCLNCGGMSPQLIESTLFGYERGAFTGAMQQSKGVFEAADHGTLFLDEIGELPLEAQASLLRVLETKRLVRVGATSEVEIDVRIVAATHRDLEAMCRQGTFRWDLYYRLNVITLRVPSLRQRLEDILPLAHRFAEIAAAANHVAIEGIEPEAVAMLMSYDWPGNVRELKNTIERAVVVTSCGWIRPEHLPEQIREGGATVELDLRALVPQMFEAPEEVPAPRPEHIEAPSVQAAIDEVAPEELLDFKTEMAKHEIKVLVRALRLEDHNQTAAAKRLKMPLRTFVHKLKVHDIKRLIEQGAV